MVFTLDQPWEGNTSAYFTVLKTEEKYQLYYRGLHHPGGRQAHRHCACYAESTDGIHWRQEGDGPVITGLYADSQNTAMYDPDAGEPLPEDREIHGRDIRPLLSGGDGAKLEDKDFFYVRGWEVQA